MDENDNFKKFIKLADGLSGHFMPRNPIDPIDCIKEILNSNFDINYSIPMDSILKKWRGFTLLHLVLDLHKLRPQFFCAAIDLLLSYGADVTHQDHNDDTPAHIIFKMELVDLHQVTRDCLNRLLSIETVSKSAKNPHDKNNISHLHIACANDNVKSVEYYLKIGANVNEAISSESRLLPGYTALHIALKYRNEDMIKLLLDHGADLSCLNADGMSPLQLLTKKMMLEDKDIENRHILSIVSGYNEKESRMSSYIGLNHFHIQCIDFFNQREFSNFKKLLNGVDVNSHVKFDSPLWPGFTALHFAAQNNLDMVMLLLKNGADLLAKDANGITPLDLCCKKFKLSQIGVLLRTQKELKCIKLCNAENLFDTLALFYTKGNLQNYLETTDNINNYVPFDSPIWPGYSILHLAVLLSQRHQVKLCLERGVDYTMKDANNMTALHLAFQLEKKDCIEAIVEAHFIIFSNPMDSHNLSHFHIACMIGNLNVVENFLNFKDLDFNLQTTIPYIINYGNDEDEILKIPVGSTAFHIAAANQSKKLIKLLLKSKVDPNLCDADGFTWVHRLSLHENFHLHEYLWKHPESFKSNPVAPGGLSHLHIACCAGDVEAVEALLPLTTNVNEPVTSELKSYIKHSYNTGFIFMDVFAKLFIGDTPLHLAARSRESSVELVDLLLKNGADMTAKNSKGQIPVYIRSDLKILLTRQKNALKHLILEFKSKENFCKGITGLHFACALKDISLMKKFFEEEEDFNSKIDPDSEIWPCHTPLSLLIKFECLDNENPLLCETVNLLLGKILEKYENSTNKELRESAKRPKISSSLNQELVINKEGLTVFHLCCMGSNEDTVERFILAGVDINSQVCLTDKNGDYSKAGYTPLHYAVEFGSDGILEMLLRYNADVSVEDIQGRTPLQLAAEVRFDKVKIFSRWFNINGKQQFALMDSLVKNKHIRLQDCLDHLIHDSPNDIDLPGKLCTYMRSWARKLPPTDFKLLIERIPVDVLRDVLKFEDSAGRNVIHYIVSTKLYFDRDRYYTRTSSVNEIAKNIEVLLKKGCEINHQNINGKTPLHYAVASRQVIVVQVLLGIGADINIVDNTGMTPYTLHYQKDQWSSFDDLWGSGIELSVREDVNELFRKHVDHIRAAGLYFNKVNQECYEKNFLITNRIISYSQTLNEMAEKKIYKSISLRDILTEKLVCKFPIMSLEQRQEILKCLKSNELYNKYPDWSSMFKLQYRKILKGLKLFKPAFNSLRVLLDTRLPNHCLESVLTHSNICDWSNLRQIHLE